MITKQCCKSLTNCNKVAFYTLMPSTARALKHAGRTACTCSPKRKPFFNDKHTCCHSASQQPSHDECLLSARLSKATNWLLQLQTAQQWVGWEGNANMTEKWLKNDIYEESACLSKSFHGNYDQMFKSTDKKCLYFDVDSVSILIINWL